MARRYKPIITYKLREIPIKQIKVWKEAQARKLDREGISELAKSIKNEGLLNPPLVQKEGGEYLLMSGQRRLAAMKRLGAKKIPVHVITKKTAYELEGAKAASVVENIHRANMSQKDTAEACKFLAEKIGKVKAARSMGMSIPTLNKYLGFAGVPDRLKDLVPHMLTRDEVTKLYLAVPNAKKAERIAEKISKLDPQLRKKYLIALSRSPNATHKKLLKAAKGLRIKTRIGFKLSKTNARKLARVAEKNDTSPDEMASKIISSYLKKKK